MRLLKNFGKRCKRLLHLWTTKSQEAEAVKCTLKTTRTHRQTDNPKTQCANPSGPIYWMSGSMRRRMLPLIQ